MPKISDELRQYAGAKIGKKLNAKLTKENRLALAAAFGVGNTAAEIWPAVRTAYALETKQPTPAQKAQVLLSLQWKRLTSKRLQAAGFASQDAFLKHHFEEIARKNYPPVEVDLTTWRHAPQDVRRPLTDILAAHKKMLPHSRYRVILRAADGTRVASTDVIVGDEWPTYDRLTTWLQYARGDSEAGWDWTPRGDDGYEPSTSLSMIPMPLDTAQDHNAVPQWLLNDRNGAHCFMDPIVEWMDDRYEEDTRKLTAFEKSKSVKGKRLSQAEYKTTRRKMKTKNTRFRKWLAEAKRLKELYADGVPKQQTVFDDIAQLLNINIRVMYVLARHGEEHCMQAKSANARRTFNYVLSGWNHVQYAEKGNLCRALVSTGRAAQSTPATREELEDLRKELRKTGECCIWREDSRGIRQLNSLSRDWHLHEQEDKYRLCCNDFERKWGPYELEYPIQMPYAAMSAPDGTRNGCELMQRQSRAVAHVQSGLWTPGAADAAELWTPLTGGEELGLTRPKYSEESEWWQCLRHIDQYRSYAETIHCLKDEGWYKGMPMVLTDLRRCSTIRGEGFYIIDELSFENAHPELVAFQWHSRLAGPKGMFRNKCTYSTIILRFLETFGVKYVILAGCWAAAAREDFTFPEAMHERDGGDMGPRMYSKWVGCTERQVPYTSFETYGCTSHDDPQKVREEAECFAAMLRGERGDGSQTSIRATTGGAISVSYPKRRAYTAPHVSAFLKSGCIASTLKQGMVIGVERVVRLHTDAIFLQWPRDGPEPELVHGFRKKPCVYKSFFYQKFHSDRGYLTCNYPLHDLSVIEKYGEDQPCARIQQRGGAAGSGKTYNTMRDVGNLGPIVMVFPSHKLRASKQQEIMATPAIAFTETGVHAWRLSPHYNERFRTAATIIVDECTMISKVEQDKWIKDFPHQKIIFVGDYGKTADRHYQLGPIEGDNYDPQHPAIGHRISYAGMRRCKCEKLKSIMLWLRAMIDDGCGLDPAKRGIVLLDLKQKLQSVTKKELQKMYKNEDIVLAYTHNRGWGESCPSMETYFDLTPKSGPIKWDCQKKSKTHIKGSIQLYWIDCFGHPNGKEVAVYKLFRRGQPNTVYIGRTNRDTDRREKEHIADAKKYWADPSSDSKKCTSFLLYEGNAKVEMHVLYRRHVLNKRQEQEVECDAWDEAKAAGLNVINGRPLTQENYPSAALEEPDATDTDGDAPVVESAVETPAPPAPTEQPQQLQGAIVTDDIEGEEDTEDEEGTDTEDEEGTDTEATEAIGAAATAAAAAAEHAEAVCRDKKRAARRRCIAARREQLAKYAAECEAGEDVWDVALRKRAVVVIAGQPAAALSSDFMDAYVLLDGDSCDGRPVYLNVSRAHKRIMYHREGCWQLGFSKQHRLWRVADGAHRPDCITGTWEYIEYDYEGDWRPAPAVRVLPDDEAAPALRKLLNGDE
eukprot:g428.t1